MRQVILSVSKMAALSIILIVVAINITAFTNIRVQNSGEKNTMIEKSIEKVLKKHTKELMSIPGVVGTAQGLCVDEPCIKVFVIEKTLELEEKIPAVIEGYPVMVEEIGEVRALPENKP